MARNENLLRALKVLHYLETSRAGLTFNDIRERLQDDGFECVEKTIRRDMKLLENAGLLELEKLNTCEGSKYKHKHFAQIRDNISFTSKELLAHFMARKHLEHLKGSPLYEALDQFFTKLEKIYGTKCEAFDEYESLLEFKPKMTWHNSVPSHVLDTVYHALEEGHTLKFEYKAQGGERAGEFSLREVGPECLYFADAGVYLIAKDLSKNEPRTYALARMKAVVDDPYRPYDKEGLSPATLFKDSFGVLNTGEVEQVEILLNGPIAQYVVERKWHESQKSISREDGIHLLLEVKVNKELARWVLGLGEEAEVVQPSSLQGMVADMAESISANYKKKIRAA
jgi:predicted DNA-binding transcriptional regulator YafY